jgi:cation diffusion facilitator CzcD-associated flavoprotein CzcO
MGCKRVLISNDYYPTLERANVELIPFGVREVRGSEVVASDGKVREVDAIILATGFDVTGQLAAFPLVGLGGRSLNDEWHSGIEAYLGITVAGFPNFYMLAGPNTGLGHNSLVFMIEAQVRYALQCIQTLEREALDYLDVLPERQRAFNERLRRRMGRTVWSTGCQSWYLDERGHNFTLWPGYTFEYWLRTRRPDRRAFRAV